jgi:hypothetical protein
MPRSEKVEEVSRKAVALEKQYEWARAEELYQQALGLIGKGDSSKRGEIQERIAYCLYRGAFQAETQEEFKGRMLEAVEAYEKAAEVYEKVEHAKSLYCKALALYANSRTLIVASRKKAVLDACGELLKGAMKTFEAAGDRLSYGKACNDLLFCLLDRRPLEWDWTENKKHLEEAIKHGQNTISMLSEVGDEGELARAYFIVGLHSVLAGLGYLDGERSEEFKKTALNYAEKALELSKKTGDAALIARSNLLTEESQFHFTGNLELSLEHAEEGLKQAKRTKDANLIGYANGDLADVVGWILNAEEAPDKLREGLERAKQHVEEAARHYLIVCYYDYLPAVYSLYIEGYYFLARDVETDVKERRSALEKAIEIGQEGLEHAEQSGMPGILNIHHSLSKALYSLSKMETRMAEKRRLLEEASEHREKSASILEKTAPPYDHWNRGVFHNYAALIKAELATIEADKEKKRELLEEAVSSMERCIELCTKWTTLNPTARLSAVLGRYYDWFGDILDQLYSLTTEEETLEKAIEVRENTAETYRKAELPSRVAEAQWHVARLYDQLGENTKAQRNYQSASKSYEQAAKKIPGLKELYIDHAVYMRGWSEIEKARHHHAQRHYGQAREHYRNAAGLHESTERWKYLSPNYLAWAKLEEAEHLSREEHGEEAIRIFKEAADLFYEAKDSIKRELQKIHDLEEKKIANELVKVSDLRHEYCQGRITLEEAKILDRRGKHVESSRKYGSATEAFQKILGAKSKEASKELLTIIYLCKAWEKMMMAEAKASSIMYGEAAELFQQAKEHTLDQPSSLLALANSSFCKALEAGTEFEITRDEAMYLDAKKHMEAAENYYLKAGFRNASEYARATHMLFDAFMYLHRAETETEPRKKAQDYQIAEKVLQASAGLYVKARHPEKSEEVHRLLESVREKRQLAISLTEVLHAPTIASATTSFSTPAPTHEQAVGLGRFEHADIQANLIIRLKDVRVGQDIDLEIELINAGKAPALLIKVQELIPEGFEVKSAPETYRVEDRYLNMKGKKLAPLKTEEVRLVLRPATKGTFTLKPRIMYLDETGKYKSHEPEPATITVKELGIKGWIKGER